MILKQNQSNTVILTLSESVVVTGSPIYFLFRLYNLTTHQEKLFTSPDLSTNIVRYNKFEWTLTGSSYENLTGGTINIQPDGELYLDVYEQTTPHNLAISGTSGIIIEKQLVQVKGTDLNRFNISYSGNSNLYNAYQP